MRVFFNTKQFVYTCGQKTFSQEISTLNRSEIYSRIYQDAADLGFTMVSDKTGIESVWYLNRTKEHDGDLEFWEFNPTPETLKKIPALRGHKVIIFND